MTISTDEPNPLLQLTLEQLRTRTSKKWRTYPDDVLPLWIAEMDVLLAEPIARALQDAITRGDTGYPVGTDYAEALSGFAASRWGWDTIDINHTARVPDVMRGITEIIRLLTAPGDSVIVNNPVYPPFYAFTTHADRQVVEAPLNPIGRLDLDVLEAAFERTTRGGRTVAYLLCNPHNPTGTVHTPEELATVAVLADRYGVRVIVDEIHAPLALPGATFTPYLTVPGTDTAFSLMSASKGWNLAGLKAAIVIAGTSASADLARLPEEVGHGPSHLGMIAHTAAYQSGEAWLDALIAGLDENRSLLTELLRDQVPAIRGHAPEAAYLAWLDCRAISEDPAALILEQSRVAVNSGTPFGTGGKGWVRLNFATSPDIIRQAIAQIATSIDE